MENKLTAVRRVASEIRTRLLAIVQSISQGSHMLRPEVRLQEQGEMLADYVNAGDTVLDVGCGTGYLSANLEDMYDVKPTGLDVQDIRERSIDFNTFDGTSIPFPDRSFDHVLLSYALHHSQDPTALIQECRRVARNSIIVFEDLPDHLFGRFMLYIHIWIFALRYPFQPAKLTQYRSALRWLHGQATGVVQIAIPPQWLHVLYPRDLLVYSLSDD